MLTITVGHHFMLTVTTNSAGMERRPLGRTGLSVSAVGFGTSQLRRVTRSQAIDTLLRGFDLGVNIVHTAPDYEGAEDLVAESVARTSHHVIVASNGYDVHYNRTGRVRLFERLFEQTCRKLRTDRLDLFGIASVDDREAFGENVWGRSGMVEFLWKMKARGRLGATFCTTHGEPAFVRRLVESGAFEAIMLAYNDLGFHLLTLNPPPGRHFEDVAQNGRELFPLCQERGIGVMVMLPFGGGMLCRSKAFEPEPGAPEVAPPVRGDEVLRSILARPEVACVLPGTACVEEAQENALAGHSPPAPDSHGQHALRERIAALQTTLCSRCGICQTTCSQKLPISWMFRASYMSLYPCSPYETWEEIEYFRQHPALQSTCASCTDVTCACPAGIDVPRSLISLHEQMLDHLNRGLIALPEGAGPEVLGNRWFAARVVRRELPTEMRAGQRYLCRLFVENCGLRRWHPPGAPHGSVVRLEVLVDSARIDSVELREKVIRGRRCHFVFELVAPVGAQAFNLRLRLVRDHPLLGDRNPLVLFCHDICVRED